MKKFLLFLTAISLVLVSCEGDAGVNGSSGKDGKDGANANWHTETFVVQAAEWKLRGEPGELNSLYFVDFKVPKLTQSIFDKGTVIGYLSVGDKIKNGLPYVLHLGEEVDGKELLWTQTYDFDFEPGWIRFSVTFSDFETGNTPGGETIHLVLMWE